METIQCNKRHRFFAKACEEAPFFGQKEMAFEIARILRSVNKKVRKI